MIKPKSDANTKFITKQKECIVDNLECFAERFEGVDLHDITIKMVRLKGLILVLLISRERYLETPT